MSEKVFDECQLAPHVLDRGVAQKLWELSEKKTNCKWEL